GGLCARALRFGGPDSLEDVVLRHALGEPVSGIARESAASGVMMIPIPCNGVYMDATGGEDALCVPGVEDVVITAKQGQRLLRLPEGNSYLGFIFARAGTPGEVEKALREGHRRLRFEMAAELPVLCESKASLV
ncbi:MAG: ATP-grasp domain-containing protein, partial [Bryobacteraceae bacterium]